MPELSLSSSPLLKGLPTHASVPCSGPTLTHQAHSASRAILTHHTCHLNLHISTGRQAHRETEAQRAQPPNVNHAWDHMVQLLGQAEQRGNRVPAHLPTATSSALPPPSLWAKPWGARWLSGLPTSSDPAGKGEAEDTPGTNTWESPTTRRPCLACL